MKSSLATLFLGATLSLHSTSVQALSGPESHVTSIANSVMRLANSGNTGNRLQLQFEKLLTTHANMNGVAIFALGRYRKNLPASQKSTYYKLVKSFVAGLFVKYADDFKGNGLTIRNSRPNGKSVIVDSRIEFSGRLASPVLWRVYSRGSRHRVTDVNIRGVWMRIQMRQTFTRLLKKNKGDINSLMTYLQSR